MSSSMLQLASVDRPADPQARAATRHRTSTRTPSVTVVPRETLVTKPAESKPPKELEWIPWLVALLLIACFLGVSIYILIMLLGNGLKGTSWERVLIFYAGIETIGFAAVSFMFGRQVQASRVASAKLTAEQSQRTADQAQTRARVAEARGAALRRTIEAELATVPESTRNPRLDSSLRAILHTAQISFPA